MAQTTIRDTSSEISGPAGFPRNRNFSGLNRPSRVECDLRELEVEGHVPLDLNGAFYRCGPDPQFPPKFDDDLYINGDGIVTMFRIVDGHVDLKLRYVRTEKFEAERAARRALFGAYRNPFTDDPTVAGVDRTTANTSIIWHGGRLFAVKEDGLPHRLDPYTLDTLGKWDFEGALRSRTFTAHPKLDPYSGELVAFGYSAGGDEVSDDIALLTCGRDGSLTSENWIKPPYQSMIHDWGATENHLILPIYPVTTDAERLRAGGPRWLWEPGLPMYVLIVPRGGGADEVRTFEADPCFSFHTMNAFEDAQGIHLDLNVGRLPPLPDVEGRIAGPEDTDQYLTRWTFDLSKPGSSFESRPLWPGGKSTDFSDPDPRYLTRPYRYGFFAARDRSVSAHEDLRQGIFFNVVGRIDHRTGQVEEWCLGDDAALQEPLFVPRSHDAPEGDGYVLTVANRWPAMLGELLIFDSQRIPEGPIARVQIPLFQRPVFHSAWVNAEDLPGL